MPNPAAKAWGHLYGKRWQRLRLEHLSVNPLCVKCEASGRVTAATVVDHCAPHKGDVALFYDRSNWQSLCKPCHDGAKQREEIAAARDALEPTCDAEGYPLDGSW